MQLSIDHQLVLDTIVEVTRYPKSLLEEDADLENDLGIDSVKRVEILIALGKKVDVNLVNSEQDGSIRTIGQIINWVKVKSDQRRATVKQTGSSELAPLVFDSNGNRFAATPRRDVLANLINSKTQQPTDLSKREMAEHGLRRDIPQSNSIPRPKIASSVPTDPATRAASTTFATSGSNEPETQPLDTLERRPLSGRLALVTGSGRGVGRAIARLLASRGATVIINSFHSRDLGEQTTEDIIAQGGQAFHYWGSVANASHVDDIFDQIESRFGYLDILVCNASDGKLGNFLDAAAEDMERAFRTNVIGHHHCARRASVLMRRRGGGSIVTMSSIAARRYVEGLGAQGVIKAAVESLTRHLACELGGFGIRANCVAGGPVYGQVLGSYPDARATLNYWETLIPDGELCTPSDLARTVAFLVSDESRGVNGAVWNVDHGLATRAHSRPLPQSQQEIIETTLQ